MKPIFVVAPVVLGALSACGGSTTSGGTVDGGAVTIHEAENGAGGGAATSIVYDSTTGTLIVEGLPFDGDGVYADVGLGPLGGAMIFEGDDTALDPSDSDVIDQLVYRGLYRVSFSGETEYGIVRAGGLNDYGFGGFVYLRNGDVTLPVQGQAFYEGSYAGLRTYTNSDDLSYVQGTVEASVDFDAGGGLVGQVENREIFELNGNSITADKLPGGGVLPVLYFTVNADGLGADGTLMGNALSTADDSNGAAIPYETGSFYGLIAGDDADELVGILVVEGQDPEFASSPGEWADSEVTYQETGGFIAAR